MRLHEAGDEGAVLADVRVQPDGRRRPQELPVARIGRLQVVVFFVVVVVVMVIEVVVVTIVMVVVVTIVVAVVVPAGARRRHVVVALDAAAELHAVTPEAQLLVAEGRERGLVRPRGEGLGPRRQEVAELQLGPEPPRDVLELPLVDEGAGDVRAVVEPRVDVVHAADRVHMIVGHVDGGEGGAHALDEPVVEVAQADVPAAHAAPRGEVDRDLLLVPLLLFLLVSVIVVLAVAVTGMEQVLEREAEAAVLEREAAAGERPIPEVADPGAGAGELARRVEDGPLRRVVVAGLPPAAAPPEEEVALRVLQVGVGGGLPVGAPEVGAQLRPRAVGQRLAVTLGRGEQVPVGRVGRDDVDEPADDARAVQQRRRPAHDLDALGAARIDGHPVVVRRRRQVAGADAVLDDEHPVAAEAADHRPARAGAEAAVGDARLVLEGLADGGGGDAERIDGGDRVERLQRRRRPDRGRGDRHLLAHRRQVEGEVGGRGSACSDGDRPAGRGEAVALRGHLVGADRHVRDLEPAFLGQGERARPQDQDHRTVDEAAVLHQGHGAAHRAGLLRPGRRGGQKRRRRHDPEPKAPRRFGSCATEASPTVVSAAREVLPAGHRGECNV